MLYFFFDNFDFIDYFSQHAVFFFSVFVKIAEMHQDPKPEGQERKYIKYW